MQKLIAASSRNLRNWMVVGTFIILAGFSGWMIVGSLSGMTAGAAIYVTLVIILPTREMIFHPLRRYFESTWRS